MLARKDKLIATLRKPPPEVGKIVEAVKTSLDDNKAEDIMVIDLIGRSDVADYMVIASGRSSRHVGALADHIARKLKEEKLGSVRTEGTTTCDWVLIDAGDVIVHLFRPEVREFYELEKMWAPQSAPKAGMQALHA